MSLKISTCNEAGITDAELASFYLKTWQRPISLSRPDFLKWQTSSAPFSNGKNQSIVCTIGDMIVGCMIVTPSLFRSGNTTVLGAQLSTWAVAREYSGRGLGAKMLASLQKRYDILTGAGITDEALSLYLKSGFTFFRHIPRFVHINNIEQCEKIFPINDRSKRLIQKMKTKKSNNNWEAIQCDASQLPQEIYKNSNNATFVRSQKFGQWRFDDHPAFDYETYYIKSYDVDVGDCSATVRFDEVDGGKVIHLIDYSGSNTSFTNALNFAEDMAEKIDAAFVDVTISASYLTSLLRKRGWTSVVDETFFTVPSLLNPVEIRNPPTTSVIYWDKFNLDQTYDIHQMFISKADMDLDRPTTFWYEKNGC